LTYQQLKYKKIGIKFSKKAIFVCTYLPSLRGFV